MMYLLSPFLNKLINSLKRKEYQKLLLILIVGFSVLAMFVVCILIEWIRKKILELIKRKNKILNS